MRNSKRLLLPLVLCATLVSGCATGLSNLLSVCPPLVPYDKETLAQADRELGEIEAAGHYVIPRMIVDYQGERDLLRKCQSPGS